MEKISLAERIDYVEKLPKLHEVPDEMTILRARFDQEIGLEERLKQAGLSIGERAAVSNAFAASEFVNGRWITVGEIRKMPDEQLIQLHGLGGHMGPKRLQILRKLFGSKIDT